MKWYGLTGGIATGKSTVSTMLRELGVRVIDADDLARDVVAPGEPALQRVVEAFGPAVLAPDGTLDRPRLGALVFGDEPARTRLNAILHPAIAARTAQLLVECRAAGEPFVVYDAALIVENGLQRMMDGLVVVTVPPQLQRSRLAARDGLTDDAIEARLAAQLPLADKEAAADWLIDNSQSRQHTRAQVEALVATWQRHLPG